MPFDIVFQTTAFILMTHRYHTPRLKSRFTAGNQCHKLLWWRVHEPLAVELQSDKVLQTDSTRAHRPARWHVNGFQVECS
jgi:hypothetical protein